MIIQGNLAFAVWNAGRVEEALTLVRRNIKRTPEVSGFYELLGNYHSLLGRVGEAQTWYEEAFRQEPGYRYVRLSRCRGYLNLGDEQSAMDCSSEFSKTPSLNADLFKVVLLSYQQAE